LKEEKSTMEMKKFCWYEQTVKMKKALLVLVVMNVVVIDKLMRCNEVKGSVRISSRKRLFD
jgi:hypothetical protein